MIRAGEHEDLSLICNEIGISNHLTEESEWVKARINNNSIDWSKLDTKESVVPDVRGMTLRDALYLLENKKLKVTYSGSGRVTQQSVVPGANTNSANEINLTLG